jgi:hypothetical protein
MAIVHQSSSAGLPMMQRVPTCRDVPHGEGKLTRGEQSRRRRAPVQLRPARRRVDLDGRPEEERIMTNPQEQFGELTRRTQENFKHLWEQWTQRSNELLKGVGGRSRSVGDAPGNPEQVLDAVFDFAENLIAQQRAFAKQMLRAASQGQQTIADVADSTASRPAPTGMPGTTGSASPTTTGPEPSATPGS